MNLHLCDYIRFFHNFYYWYFLLFNGKIYFAFLLYHTLFNTHINTTITVPRFTSLAPPTSLSHSPDLGCVGAWRTMFLDRLLAQPPLLLLGRTRPAGIWVILDLARTGCPNSENQDTLDNDLWWRYLGFEWQYPSRSFSSLVLTVPQASPAFTFHPCSASTHFFASSPFFCFHSPHTIFSFISHPCFHSQEH